MPGMSLKQWFARYLPGAGQTSTEATEVGTNLAVAALLGLEPAATQALVEEAERQIDRSHDLYQFTSQINRTYSEADKVRLLEALWRVADADTAVHKYEEHLIRRVADLLHVPHSGFIAAKLRATGNQPSG